MKSLGLPGVENIVADTISRLPSTTIDRYEPSTTRDLSQTNVFFTTRLEQKVGDGYPLDLDLVHQEQQKYLGNKNGKISAHAG